MRPNRRSVADRRYSDEPMDSPTAEKPARRTYRRLLQSWLPVAVSVGIFAWLLAGEEISLRGMATALSPGALLVLAAALLVWGAATLAIEAITLVRLANLPKERLSLWTAAKIKAATYLPYTINYSLGVGALTILVRRRAELSLSHSAGLVLLIAAVDLGMTLFVAMVGVLLLGTGAAFLRSWMIVAAVAALAGGFLLLRLPVSLGPLERLRQLEVLTLTRTTPLHRIAELVFWRLIFVSLFFAMALLCFRLFDLSPPLPVVFLNMALVALVAALPIAVAGLGTSQIAFKALFADYGDPQTLFNCSLALQTGMILLRSGLGAAFAREWTREGIVAAREEQTSAESAS